MAGELRFPRVNMVIITGRLTRDLELRYTPKGTAVVAIPIAFDKYFKDDTGADRTIASFIDVIAWTKTAEYCAKNLHKGSPILVEGYLQTRTYTNKDNRNIKITEIVAARVNFLEKNFEKNTNNISEIPETYNNNYATENDTEDDIPF